MSAERLTATRSNDRVVVRLARPERLNAIDAPMVQQLHSVLERMEREPTGVVILTGGGEGVFAAGADTAELRDRTREDALAGINLTLFDRRHRSPLPTIAAIDGPALGGGAELAYACDCRIASSRAVFGQPESQLGIMAAAAGGFRLPELVGDSLAGELLFTGRRLTADEALAAGLVSRVVEATQPLTEAHSVSDAVVLRLTKLALNAPRSAHLAVERAAQTLLFEDPEKHERMTAFLEPRR